MKNIMYQINDDNELLIRINLGEHHGLSPSGRSITIASTEGSVEVDGILLKVSVYKRNPRRMGRANADLGCR